MRKRSLFGLRHQRFIASIAHDCMPLESAILVQPDEQPVCIGQEEESRHWAELVSEIMAGTAEGRLL